MDIDAAVDDAARAWGPVRAALDGLSRWAALAGSERVVDAAEFASMVETAFDCAAAPADSETAGAVVALPVLDARGLDFDLVFVIGLNDGIFPSYHPDDPLLPDEVKLALNRPLGEALRRRFGADCAEPRRRNPAHALRTQRRGFSAVLSRPLDAVAARGAELRGGRGRRQSDGSFAIR